MPTYSAHSLPRCHKSSRKAGCKIINRLQSWRDCPVGKVVLINGCAWEGVKHLRINPAPDPAARQLQAVGGWVTCGIQPAHLKRARVECVRHARGACVLHNEKR